MITPTTPAFPIFPFHQISDPAIPRGKLFIITFRTLLFGTLSLLRALSAFDFFATFKTVSERLNITKTSFFYRKILGKSLSFQGIVWRTCISRVVGVDLGA
jgi:hypothetical protein